MTETEAILSSALTHFQTGNIFAAIQSCEQAITIDPNCASAWHLYGVLAHHSGQFDTAVQRIQLAITIGLDSPIVFINLGAALNASGRFTEAIECFRSALQLLPECAEAHFNLGVSLFNQGEHDEAVARYRRTIELKPQLTAARIKLGFAYKRLGKWTDAIVAYQQALAESPRDFDVLFNLGLLNELVGQSVSAIEYYRRAIEVLANSAEAHNNLGVALKDIGNFDQASQHLETAIKINPRLAFSHNNLGNLQLLRGEIPEAIQSYSRSLELAPEYIDAHDNLIRTMQYSPDVTLGQLTKAAITYNQQHAARYESSWPIGYQVNSQNQVLRLGFMSADFSMHPVGQLILPLLNHLSREQCTVACYSNRFHSDSMTNKIASSVDTWREVHQLSDDQLAELIRADQIDILIELSGYTAYNRLMTLARKPAPIQMSWLGGVGPVGLSAIDYFIADRITVPDELLGQYREQVVRLPTIWCCAPPEGAPEVGQLPAFKNGYVTFGSFNNLAKINPLVVQTWAQILKRLPASRLIMKYLGLDSPSVTQRYRELFAAEGVDPDRVEMQGFSPFAEMLEMYNARVDLALDPFPFNGGMTTMLALYMGVPVVTMPGETYASRQSLAILSALGMSEEESQALVARDRAEYVERAVEVASDLARLAEWRRQLRGRCLASALFDGPRFAREFLQQLRAVWRDWVAKHPIEQP